MARIVTTSMIQAPVQKVYDFVVDKARLPEWWPSMQKVWNVEKLPNGGFRFDWTYRMAGISVDGSGQDAEIIPNQLIVTENQGGIPSRFVWNFQALGKMTRVTCQSEYKLIGAVARLAGPVVVKLNEREAQTIMVNLKTMMEKEG